MAKKKAAPKSNFTQKVIDGAFPEEIQELEDALRGYDKMRGNHIKAKDNYQAAYDILKATMRESGLDEYWSYRLRKRIELKHEDAKIKVKDVKIEEATPFQPK